MYLYALCLTIDTEQLPQGLQAPLSTIQVEQLSAVVEAQIDLAQLQENEAQLIAAVMRHDQIICELFQQTTLLPLRFGTQFATEAALRSHLQTQSTQYLKQLQALQHKAEICLTLTPTALEQPAVAPDLKGSAYFLAKKQRLQAQADTQQTQQAQLGQLQQAIAQTFPISYLDPAQADRAYLLLTAEQTHQLPETLKTWHSLFPLWQITASPPLPPYHFV